MKKKYPGRHEKKNTIAPIVQTDETVIIEPISAKQNPSLWFKYAGHILFAFAFIVYANSLFLDFNLDDGLMITDNKFTKQGIAGIRDILTHDSFVGYFGEQNVVEGGRYRPLSQVMFAIEYAIFGLNPLVGHLLNVLMYAFTCVFVFFILNKLFPEEKPALLSLPFITSLLFIAHPLHTEVVANIKGRDEIMSLMGALAALYYSLRYVDTQKVYFLVLSAVFFFLALLSKENAITFLGIVPLTIFVFYRSLSLKTHIITLSPLIAVSIVYLFIRYRVLGYLNAPIAPELLNNPFLHASTGERYATIMHTWGKYLRLIFIPHPLTHDYYPKQIPIVTWSDAKAFVPAVIYSIMLIYALIRVWKKDILAYAILFFFITFSVSSNLFINIGTFMNERFMFVPLLGFCIILALFVVRVYYSIKTGYVYRNMLIAALAVLLCTYSIKTISRNLVWKDGYTLFTTDVKVSANSAKCNISAAGLMMEKALKEKNETVKMNLLTQAVKYMEKGVTLHPLYVSGWLVLGRAQIELKNYAYAAVATENCLKINPGHKEALNNLQYIAQVNTNNANYRDALLNYKTLLNYQPQQVDYEYEMVSVYEKMNRLDTAMILLNSIITRNPSYYMAYSKLGEYHGKFFNDLDKSISYFLKSLELNPGQVFVLENLGVVYGMKGDFDKSITYFEKAIEIQPDNPQLYNNLATSYRNSGNAVKAAEFFAKAAEVSKAASGKY